MPKNNDLSPESPPKKQLLADPELVDTFKTFFNKAVDMINEDITQQLDRWPVADLINELYNYGVISRQEIQGVNPINLMHTLPHLLVDDEDFYMIIAGRSHTEMIELADRSASLELELKSIERTIRAASDLYDHRFNDNHTKAHKDHWLAENYPEYLIQKKLSKDKIYIDGLIAAVIECFIKAKIVPSYYMGGYSQRELLIIARERMSEFLSNEIRCNEYRVRKHGYFFAKQVVATKDRFDDDFDFEIYDHNLVALRNYLVDLPPKRLSNRCCELLALLGLYYQLVEEYNEDLLFNTLEDIHNLLLVNHHDMCNGYLLNDADGQFPKRDSSPDYAIHVYTSYRDTYPCNLTQVQVDYMSYVIDYKLSTMSASESIAELYDPLTRIETIFRMELKKNPLELFRNFFDWGTDASSQEIVESCIYLILMIPFLHITPHKREKASQKNEVFSLSDRFENSIRDYLLACNNLALVQKLDNFIAIIKKLRDKIDLYLDSDVFESPWKESTRKFWQLAVKEDPSPEILAISEVFTQ